jgi:hypothetical protein
MLFLSANAGHESGVVQQVPSQGAEAVSQPASKQDPHPSGKGVGRLQRAAGRKNLHAELKIRKL